MFLAQLKYFFDIPLNSSQDTKMAKASNSSSNIQKQAAWMDSRSDLLTGDRGG